MALKEDLLDVYNEYVGMTLTEDVEIGIVAGCLRVLEKYNFEYWLSAVGPEYGVELNPDGSITVDFKFDFSNKDFHLQLKPGEQQ